MLKRGPVSRAALLCVSLAQGTAWLAACQASPAPAPTVAVKQIDHAQARKLALQKYRQLFGQTYFKSPTSDRYIRFPELDEASFTLVEDLVDAWGVVCDPPAGVIVRARVSKTGEWVELNSVSYSAE